MGKYYLDFEKTVQEIEKSIKDLGKVGKDSGEVELAPEIKDLEKRRDYILETIYKNLSPWQIVQVARHPERPLFIDYLKNIFDDFIEIHGDRYFGDDASIITGYCKCGNDKFVVVGEEKGRTTKEKIYRNFGYPQPEGYRKALRAMKLAEKFHKPVITFVDTPGAHPGIGSEERGIGEAIARNLFEMSTLKTPVITVIIGEGGSGGALAIAVADRVMMLENAIYSVISPESGANILWRDSTQMQKAARALKLTSRDLIKFGIVEEIIHEPVGGAHRNHEQTIKNTKESILRNYNEIKKIPLNKLIQKRYERFRKFGVYERSI